MSRIVYVNGRYREQAEAVVSVDDPAFTFGDGVYEVCEVFDGALIEETRRLDRLDRSLKAIRIDWPIGRDALRLGLGLERRPFTVEEALSAREAFFSSATTIAMPVVSLDGRTVGDGRPGRVTLALRRAFRERAERS